MGIFTKRQRTSRWRVSCPIYVGRDARHRRVWAGTDPSDFDGDVEIVITCYGQTSQEATERAHAAVEKLRAEIDEELAQEAATSTTQENATQVAPSEGVIESTTTRDGQDSDASSSHEREVSPERKTNVPAAQERVGRDPLSHTRAPYNNMYPPKRKGRPVRGLRVPIAPEILLYYRPGDGFREDLDTILTKTGLGPAGLARSLGVSRRRIHAWRAEGMPSQMDPLIWYQVTVWAYRLRGGQWGWQR